MNIYESLRNSGEDVKHMHRDALEREVLSLRQEIIRLNTPQTPATAGECPKCSGSGSIPNGIDEMACGYCAGTGKHPAGEPQKARAMNSFAVTTDGAENPFLNPLPRGRRSASDVRASNTRWLHIGHRGVSDNFLA